MKRFLILSFTFLLFFDSKSQTIIELGIKPSEYIVRNLEGNLGIGNK